MHFYKILNPFFYTCKQTNENEKKIIKKKKQKTTKKNSNKFKS